MGKKALALLIAVLTAGQAFALNVSADSSTVRSADTVKSSVVITDDNDRTKSVSVTLEADKLNYPEGFGDEESLETVNDDGVNSRAAALTKGYSINSKKFDLRNVNGKSYTTPVRAQAPFGTCWSFATVAALESSILGAGLNGADGKAATPQTLDLSEKQLAWFSAMPLNDPNNPQNTEGQYIPEYLDNPNSYSTFMNRGGNSAFSESALMQGIGPSHESTRTEFEYHGKEKTIVSRWMDGSMQKYSYSESDNWSIPEKLRFINDYSVKESHDLPNTGSIDKYGYYTYNPEGTKAIKQELLNLRGVQIAFNADTSMPGQESDGEFISKNWAHYTYIPSVTNHAVTVIGWDDNYPKENFINGSFKMYMRDHKEVTISKQPPANGAWLVKNSWGSAENEFPNKAGGSWGIEENGKHTGYFWLSYYDKSLAVTNPVSYVVEEDDKSVNHIDQHDYMPVASTVSGRFDKKTVMANRFMAEHDEMLKQVMCYTSEPNTEVTYDIYLLDGFADKPTDGIKVATKKIKYAYKGFHKEKVSDFNSLFDVCGDGSKNIRLTKYQEYSIVVTQKAADGKYLVNFQWATDSKSGISSFKGIINREESYVYHDDYWYDYKGDDDLRDEMLKQLLAGQQAPLDEFTYDNFPIKGFVEVLDTDTVLEMSSSGAIYYGTKEHNSATLRLVVHSSDKNIPSFGESDVKWGILPVEGEKDVYLTGKRVSGDPTRYKLLAKKADSKHSRAYLTIKGIGTASLDVSTNIRGFVNIDFPFDGVEDIRVFPYTGKEIRPCKGVSCDAMVEEFIEGEDFEFTYTDNIKCGLATVEAKPKGDRVAPESYVKETFVIVPAKPVITSAQAVGSRLDVQIKDQSVSEPSGYRVRFRIKGEKKWQEAVFNGSKPSFSIYGVQGGKTYEVSVSGFTIAPDNPFWYGDKINYGKSSDIRTVTVKTTGNVQRLSGDNRFATAAEISKASFKSADTVVLTYGYNYADALAGVPLAQKLNAPILLTNKDSVPSETLKEIKRLKAKNVIILGGVKAVSKDAEKALKDSKLKVQRIAGKTRFETAAAVAKELNKTPAEVFFVFAQNYADALSVSTIAAIKGAPVIYLTKDGELDPDTAAYLKTVKGSVKKAYVVGGKNVISNGMMTKAYTALGLKSAERISGDDRYATCVAVNKKFDKLLTGNTVCVATGTDFPDALAGGVYSALCKAPMLLVNGKAAKPELSDAQKAYLKARKASSVTVFGGKTVVTDSCVKAVSDVK